MVDTLYCRDTNRILTKEIAHIHVSISSWEIAAGEIQPDAKSKLKDHLKP